MILLVDNYDSFTYNLLQLLPTEVNILRNDDPELFLQAAKAEAIVLSPGPGRPAEAGKLEALIQRFYRKKPILGICLGHQAIGEVFGARIVRAPMIMHGKQSTLTGDQKQRVMRYHSLVIDPQSLPTDLEVTAETDGCIMAIRHKRYPVFGLQFHPESIGTVNGATYLTDFLQKAGI
ncbi:aminodeoxychorismate/anthranilate synthase component II [Enterococcus pseudoavium]|uniref:Aminodeoxychorismate/anthranilate synthase component II n=1 Tax=Enterococcus pseudoavium TaxID=44007 RepID=A0AAE4HZ21_9ENTE|nr:aminodeoxychorismate/anthranilate synthase component II [Enterococcus pseudoavium]MDT2735568.1 aminodeoxychorismate/anthranilate synthase component II [Enterococcus pseudoavium]MDT2754534.1 aminodeoxychorismate/anthranilate synthase component II [Enterococcus pseudoavium]